MQLIPKNNNNNYTSLALSKWLKENGCKLDSEFGYLIHKDGTFDTIRTEDWNKKMYVNKYDLLNDVCVKYKTEFWGDSYDEIQAHTNWILFNLQMGRKDLAERYIIKNSLFNSN